MNELERNLPAGRPMSSMFKMPHTHSTTMDGGILYPIACYESNPGDQVRCTRSNVIRLMPLVAPVGQDLWAYTASYRVPFHQVWSKWPAFMAGMLSPDNEINRPKLPTISVNDIIAAFQYAVGENITTVNSPYFGPNSMWRRLGYPAVDTSVPNPDLNIRYNALYLRAWYHIWLNNFAHEWLDPERNQMLNNEYPYRDDDTMTPVEIYQIFSVRYAPHERDYFTTCLPAPQKGSAVGIPGAIGAESTRFVFEKVADNVTNVGATAPTAIAPLILYGTGGLPGAQPGDIVSQENSGLTNLSTNAVVDIYGIRAETNSDGTNGGATMLDLAHAEHLQQWLEANSDYGNDYSDFIYGHFGIRPSGLGLMVPQRLAYTRQRIQISDVTQTGGSHDDATFGPQVGGEYAGRGFSSDGSHFYSYQEDLYSAVLTLMWIRPETIYHGTHRRFLRTEPADFFSPEFIADGDQPVYIGELLDTPGNPDLAKTIFGYNDRYGELKYEPSVVTGELRQSMNSWSLHRDLPTNTALNTDFVYCRDFPDRIFSYAGTGDDQLEAVPRFVVYSHANLIARKMLPKVSRRSLIRS